MSPSWPCWPEPAAATPRGSAAGAAGDTPRKGGTLRYALGADPPGLDIQWESAGVVSTIALNMVEFLFVRDSKGKLIPQLATSAEVSPDGLTRTVKLRQGVKFHNGETMTAKDVVASYNRWIVRSPLGKMLAERATSVKALDDHTVEFKLKKSFGAFESTLANTISSMAIYPASQLATTGKDPLKEIIGTGPYKLENHQPGRMIRLVRFDGYTGLTDGKPNGFGGKKTAWLDAIEYTPIPNESARLAAFESGKYDLVHGSNAEALLNLKGARDLIIDRAPPTGNQAILFNLKSQAMTDINLRLAIQVGLDHDAILRAGLGEGNYRLDPSLMLKETDYHSAAGGDRYNQKSVAKAKEYLAKSSYQGQELRLVTSRDLVRFYNQAVVVQQQLQAIGIKVKIETYDWATALAHRDDPAAWEMFVTAFSQKYDPIEQPFMKLCKYVGWWCDPAAQKLVDQIFDETDEAKRKKANDEFQKLFYDTAPFIKFGDTVGVDARHKRLGGAVTTGAEVVMTWNCWLES